LHLDKAGASTGPADEKFGDQAWRTVDLPHDWAIELPFDKTSDTSHGFKPVGPGFLKNSIGWYRRTFDLPALSSRGLTADDLAPIVKASRGGSMRYNPIELSDAELESILRAAA
jgi:hypothetical protein